MGVSPDSNTAFCHPLMNRLIVVGLAARTPSSGEFSSGLTTNPFPLLLTNCLLIAATVQAAGLDGVAIDWVKRRGAGRRSVENTEIELGPNRAAALSALVSTAGAKVFVAGVVRRAVAALDVVVDWGVVGDARPGADRFADFLNSLGSGWRVDHVVVDAVVEV